MARVRRSGASEIGRYPTWSIGDFTATGPNRLWVADITYIPTWSGFLYLAIVLDAWSRRVVGWSMATHLRTEIVLEALNMALQQRRPAEVIHHSDQGTQYTSIAFGQRCRHTGVRPSMGSVGDCFDNAMCESFFATLECELIDRRSWPTRTEARMEVFAFIEGFYNPRLRHSALEYRSPIDFERQCRESVVPGEGDIEDAADCPLRGQPTAPTTPPALLDRGTVTESSSLSTETYLDSSNQEIANVSCFGGSFLRGARAEILLAAGPNCKRISGLLVRSKISGHDGKVARLRANRG